MYTYLINMYTLVVVVIIMVVVVVVVVVVLMVVVVAAATFECLVIKFLCLFAFTNFLVPLPRSEPVAPNRLRLSGKHGMHSPNSLTITR